MLVVAGTSIVVLAPDTRAGEAHLVRGNRPVNAGAVDPLDPGAHNSPVLRANPARSENLVVVNRVDKPSPSCAVHASFDGGGTWAARELAAPEGRSTPCFAPDATFAPDGTLYVSFTSFAPVPGAGTVPDGIWIVTSDDGGRTLSSPRQVAGPLAFHVRLTADPARSARLYLSWVQAASTSTWGFGDERRPIVVSRSDDAGGTWTEPVKVSATSRARVVAPTLAVAPTGTVLVAFIDVGDDRLDYNGAHEGRGGDPYPGSWALVVARSSDAGATWSESVVDGDVVPTDRFLMLSPPTPALAVDPGGRAAYVAFQDGRLGDPDVWVWASRDEGERWAPGVRINDTRQRDGRSQYLPQLAVAPGGRLDVVYYDRRADPDDAMNAVSVQSSFDTATTFLPHLIVSDVPFDARIGFGSERGLADLGNRLGIVATDAGSLSVWTDTRAGLPETGKQDLASALVAVSAPSRRAGSLTAVAAALGIGGLVIGIWALVRRR